jgi:hypothetical protein
MFEPATFQLIPSADQQHQSALSLVLIPSTCCIWSCIDDAEGRQALAYVVMFFNLLMHLAIVIPLSLDPTSRPDILGGQGEFLNNSIPSDQNTALTDHPYYGLFVCDLIMM